MGQEKALVNKSHDLQSQRLASSLAVRSPSSLPPSPPLLHLQRHIGNRAVTHLIQTKLKVGPANDRYEQEADRTADKVMRMNSPSLKEEKLQPKSLPITPLVQREIDEDNIAQPLQREPEEEQEETAQRQAETSYTPQVTTAVENRIQAMRGGGQSLSPSVRSFFGPRFGYDFSGVRIHNDSTAAELAGQLNAQAFTIGQDIFFGSGRYEPETAQGKWLLAHELTHTVQQSPRPLSIQTYTISPPRIQRLGFGDILDWAGDKTGIKEKLLKPVAELAQKLPVYPLVSVIAGENPITGEPVPRNSVNLLGGLLKLVPGGDEIYENLQASRSIEKTTDWLDQETTRLNISSERIRGLFKQTWDAISLEDIISPVKAFEKIKNIFTPFMGAVKGFAIAVKEKVLQFVFEGALKLGGPLATDVLNALRQTHNLFSIIIKDPIAFAHNLTAAAKKGFQQFSGNISTHLKTGLTGWLMGTLATSGLRLPESFSDKGIFSLVTQVSGFNYGTLRQILVNIAGEEKVSRAEKNSEILEAIATNGIEGAWEGLKGHLGNLRDEFLQQIHDWVTGIVRGAVARLLALFNPAGAVIGAIISTYNTIAFFIEEAKRIAALVESVFASFGKIAAGNIEEAAAYIETSMARAIPLTLSFFARFLNIGNIAEKIKNLINKSRDTVNGGLNNFGKAITSKLSDRHVGLIRYLPPDYQVRRKLYIRGSGWASRRAEVLREEIPRIRNKIKTAKLKNDLSAWRGLNSKKQIPDNLDMTSFTAVKDETFSGVRRSIELKLPGKNQGYYTIWYQVDHITPISVHWQKRGWNSGDGKRWQIAALDRKNLRAITAEHNRARNNQEGEVGRYTRKVGPNFISQYAEDGMRGAQKIDGQPFLDENQKPIR
ncbi:MAG: hypothetical protein N5P05_004260 (plasmid) [Chroococcopsis gigantea SAG 12.99]|nr:hypothetical protein [Chroococcopsis gigantea SAG 12.99]